MSEHLLIGLASIIVLGILAQWLAWRFHLPAILLLLLFGILAGPVLNILNPEAIFGEALFPLISISVAIVLFEGGMNLDIKELRQGGKVIRNLVTLGVLVTWFLTTIIGHYLLNWEFRIAFLMGAILVVSGPTVIIPLLRQVRPIAKISSVLKWEGIINDPIGAILAVLVLEIILSGNINGSVYIVALGVFKALFIGTAVGFLFALVVIVLLKRYLVPDFLQSPVTLMFVVLCYLFSNLFRMESGLLAVTVMGIVLANQKYVSMQHVIEFKENLRVLLIAGLFIILAAQIPASQLALTQMSNWLFVLLLIVIVRPLAVFVSTLHSSLKWRERLFIGLVAPRGIVAAAVVSVFVIPLKKAGFVHSESLIPLTFQVIIGTVLVYGLIAFPLAKKLRISLPDPQGILFAGAHTWAREIALRLQEEGFYVALVDSNWGNVSQAHRMGLTAYYGNIFSEKLHQHLHLEGIGKLLAVTPNDEVNSLATLHFEDIFSRSQVYQLVPLNRGKDNTNITLPMHLRGRYLFDEKATYEYLESRFRAGAVLKKNSITEEFDFTAFQKKYGDEALPLFIIPEAGVLNICTADKQPSPQPGQAIISIIDPVET
ncbi:MAG: sodium:proton antiporter [FCB group bacterium]|nr:sodium:proton antiporter [FCB group bacterium]